MSGPRHNCDRRTPVKGFLKNDFVTSSQTRDLRTETSNGRHAGSRAGKWRDPAPKGRIISLPPPSLKLTVARVSEVLFICQTVLGRLGFRTASQSSLLSNSLRTSCYLGSDIVRSLTRIRCVKGCLFTVDLGSAGVSILAGEVLLYPISFSLQV